MEEKGGERPNPVEIRVVYVRANWRSDSGLEPSNRGECGFTARCAHEPLAWDEIAQRSRFGCRPIRLELLCPNPVMTQPAELGL
jgi:hypothetical protein